MYFASTRKGIIKELCGINKVFLLLNEYGDPTFLFHNLSPLKVINKWAKFGWKSIFSSILGQWPLIWLSLIIEHSQAKRNKLNVLLKAIRFNWGADYMANFSLGWNFSPGAGLKFFFLITWWISSRFRQKLSCGCHFFVENTITAFPQAHY